MKKPRLIPKVLWEMLDYFTGFATGSVIGGMMNMMFMRIYTARSVLFFVALSVLSGYLTIKSITKIETEDKKSPDKNRG